MPVTNNVIRLLESKKIPFTAFELPSEKHSALETANLLNISPEIVFKTIVISRKTPGSKNILAIVPGYTEVDLKALAKVVNEKKLLLSPEHEAEWLTGLQAGGISPLALLNKGFEIILDESALRFEQIHISGGQRELNIRLPVSALISITNARTAPISRNPDMA